MEEVLGGSNSSARFPGLRRGGCRDATTEPGIRDKIDAADTGHGAWSETGDAGAEPEAGSVTDDASVSMKPRARKGTGEKGIAPGVGNLTGEASKEPEAVAEPGARYAVVDIADLETVSEMRPVKNSSDEQAHRAKRSVTVKARERLQEIPTDRQLTQNLASRVRSNPQQRVLGYFFGV